MPLGRILKLTRTSKTYTYFLIFILINVAGSLGLLAVVDVYSIDPMAFNILEQLVVFLPTVLIGGVIFGGKFKDVFSLGKVSFTDLIASAVLAIAIGPITSLLSLISVMFFPNNVTTALGVAYESPLILSVISICIIPAVFEELIFRGALFTGLNNVSLKRACLMGGIIFALAHFDPQQFLYTLVIGILFCYIVYRAKSVFPGMVTHFCINFSQLMLSRISFSSTEAAAESYVEPTIEEAFSQLLVPYIVMSLVSIPIIMFLLSMIGKKYGRGKSLFLLPPEKPEFEIEDESVFDYDPQRPYEERLFRWQLIVIVIIYCVSIILF